MKMIILLAGLLLTVGCTKKEIGCAIEKNASTFAVATIKAELACSNEAAIKTSVDAELAKLKLCEQPAAKGAVGDIVCAPIVNALVGIGEAQIPAEWGCTGGGKPEALKEALMAACQKAL